MSFIKLKTPVSTVEEVSSSSSSSSSATFYATYFNDEDQYYYAQMQKTIAGNIIDDEEKLIRLDVAMLKLYESVHPNLKQYRSLLNELNSTNGFTSKF